MTIAEKLATIAENEQKVYDKGTVDGNTLTKAKTWKCMFREGWRNELLPYLKYEDTCNVTDMSYAFYQNGDVVKLPELNTSKVVKFYEMCHFCTNLETFPDWDYSNGIDFDSTFSSCKKIKTIPDLDLSSALKMGYTFCQMVDLKTVGNLNTPNLTYSVNMFLGCTYLVTIESIDLTNVTNAGGMFARCYNLQNINFEGSINAELSFGECTIIKYESVMNVINALANRTEEADAFTLTLGTGNLAKITDEEKAIATEKGWTLA